MSNNKTNDNRYMWSRFALSQCYIDQWNFCSMGFYYFHFLYYVSLQIYANFRLDLPVCIVIRADYEIRKSDDWWLFWCFMMYVLIRVVVSRFFLFKFYHGHEFWDDKLKIVNRHWCDPMFFFLDQRTFYNWLPRESFLFYFILFKKLHTIFNC